MCVSLLKTVFIMNVAPNEKMKDVLRRTVSEAKAAISKVYMCVSMCT